MTNKDKMKIFFVDPGSYGSLAIYDYSLVSNLKGDITFFGNVKYDAPKIDNVKYKLIFNYVGKSKLLMGLSYILSILRFSLYLLFHKPDVIHIQWTKIDRVDLLALKFYKKRCDNIVFTVHNILPHRFPNIQTVFQNKIPKIVYQLKEYYSIVDKIIVHSSVTKEELIKYFDVDQKKIYVIPHGVLISNVNSEDLNTEKIRLINKYNLKNKIIFSTLGYQGLYKGTDLAFNAFVSSNILINKNDCVLIIAGKGKIITPEMASQFTNIIVLNEELPEITFQALFDITDVVLLPYRKISQSGVLAHTFSHKIPFIASEVGGLCESLQIGEIGWSIKPDDVDDLKIRMERILQHPEEISKIKRNTNLWDKIHKYYNWNSIGEKTLICYSN